MTVEEFAKSTEEDIKQWCLDNPDVVMARMGIPHSCDCVVASCGRHLTGKGVMVTDIGLWEMGEDSPVFPHELMNLTHRFDNWFRQRAGEPATAKEVAEALW